jgi:alpha-galactosidase
MLPIGHLGPHAGEGEVRESMFTPDEARTLLTFWSIFRSPLMIGASLPASDPVTLELLTNKEVIDVDQNSTGNRPVVTSADEIIWSARKREGSGEYLAIVNAGDTAKTIRHPWRDLGFSGKSYEVRDLWQHRELGAADHLDVTLSPHASALYQISVR